MSRVICASEAADRFQRSVGEWAAKTFPGQTDERVIAHLREEVAELAEALDAGDHSEIADGLADCELLLCVIAHEHGVRLRRAVARKYAVNLERQWRFDPDLGYDKHVTPTPASAPGEEAQPAMSQPRYRVGQRVRHARRGPGVVTARTVNGEGVWLCTVAFDNGERMLVHPDHLTPELAPEEPPWNHPPICDVCGALHAIFMTTDGVMRCPSCEKAFAGKPEPEPAPDPERPPAGPGCERCEGGRILVVHQDASLTHEASCPHCYVKPAPDERPEFGTCLTCGGTGGVVEYDEDGVDELIRCPKCNGTGDGLAPDPAPPARSVAMATSERESVTLDGASCFLCDAPIGWTDAVGHVEVTLSDGTRHCGGFCQQCTDQAARQWAIRLPRARVARAATERERGGA